MRLIIQQHRLFISLSTNRASLQKNCQHSEKLLAVVLLVLYPYNFFLDQPPSCVVNRNITMQKYTLVLK